MSDLVSYCGFEMGLQKAITNKETTKFYKEAKESF